MPKLLSKEEVETISAKMTAEYGLPAPRIIIDNYNRSYDSGLKCEIVRDTKRPIRDWFPWLKKTYFVKVQDFYAQNFEELLTKLQYELSRFDNRTKIAESFREKYALQEADQALDNFLRTE